VLPILAARADHRPEPALFDHRPRVVVLGGGSGSYTALLGLRRYAVDLTSIVTVMDSGGSSGRLREEYGVLPPGDARQCLVALAGDDETAALLRTLFAYRFHNGRHGATNGDGRSLDGHNLGNLLLTALTDITGSVEQAYVRAGRLLSAHGQVLPVSTSSANLRARLADGHVLCGESAIDVRTEHVDAAIDYVYLDGPAYPNAAAVESLRAADLVVIGPGDLFTSVIPNLLVDGIVEAVGQARYRVFVVNLMTKPGETDGYRASTFVEQLMDYMGTVRLDAVVVNTATPSEKVAQRYAAQGAYAVEADREAIEKLRIEVLAEPVAGSRYFVRHDPESLGNVLWNWLDRQLACEAPLAWADSRTA
jgi:uncharacterized cofD-like protein